MVQIIQIAVNLTEAYRGLYHTTVEFSVQPGSLATFTTPLWIQETHSGSGPVALIAGLFFSADGKTIPWRRNPRNASQYLVQIPSGVNTISASFDSVLSRDIARHRIILRWEHVLLYPAGRDIRDLRIQPTITIPSSWGYATALENLGRPTDDAGVHGNTCSIRYNPTSVERLEDSPVLVGQYLSRSNITPDGKHILALAPDLAEYRTPAPELLSKLAKLVSQTELALGPRHYDRYWMLITLTDLGYRVGLEHHDSFDGGLPLDGLNVGDQESMDRNMPLISHEYVHSWCGKFRRPAGHNPRDFSTPLDGRLLWVYEGLTQYYGQVLAARSGLLSRDGFFADLAQQTAFLDNQAGREWRSVEDTGTGVSLARNRSEGWSNWLRFADFYPEGLLVWLDVDTNIRVRTGARRSLDHFARSFLGRKGPLVVPFTLDDIVTELDKVCPYDWRSFFQTRIIDVAPQVNKDGLRRAGYEFVYLGEPAVGQHTERATLEAIWNSIGVRVAKDGLLKDVRRGGPADIAKLAPTQTIVKAGDVEFSVQALAGGITRSMERPLRLTLRQEDDTWDVELDYNGGLRYPRIVRRRYVPGEVDLMCEILREVKAA
ncbi:peptidase m61 domain-containing protein [Immersiella caudata]|uniref:Peptidase m61 domain-containing protein n=1 Tax=Immersiella caudata TaxID=314043 RepID=A0AA39XEH3_9PEZI|nr:peptidase m61 domain-containing protein [Immersiella caudata]